MESASRVSASPTLKPFSRSVTAKPARRARAPAPMLPTDALIGSTAIRPSGDLAQQPVGHLAGEPRAIFMGLDQADHGLMHRLRRLPQVVDAETGQHGRPVERLRDAGALLQ